MKVTYSNKKQQQINSKLDNSECKQYDKHCDNYTKYFDWRNTLNVRNCRRVANLKLAPASAIGEDYFNALTSV